MTSPKPNLKYCPNHWGKEGESLVLILFKTLAEWIHIYYTFTHSAGLSLLQFIKKSPPRLFFFFLKKSQRMKIISTVRKKHAGTKNYFSLLTVL